MLHLLSRWNPISNFSLFPARPQHVRDAEGQHEQQQRDTLGFMELDRFPYTLSS